jgi:hypothetical protein
MHGVKYLVEKSRKVRQYFHEILKDVRMYLAADM